MKHVIIKATRVETAAYILPDGTLARFFDLRLPDYSTLKTELEITQNWVKSISIRRSDWNWNEVEAKQKRWHLSVETSYGAGYLNLMRGSVVEVRLPHASEGSENERRLGIAAGSVRVRHPKLGNFYWHTSSVVSSDLRAYESHEGNRPTWEELVERGFWDDNRNIPVVKKTAAAAPKAKVAA